MKNFKIYLLTLFIVSILIVSGSKIENNSKKIDFYSPSKGIYIVDVNTKTCKDCIKPYVSDSLEPVEKVAEKTNSTAAINAGFFDPNNTKTTSYVTINKMIAADPLLNADLMENEKLKPYIEDILNRSEIRIQDCETGFFDLYRKFTIARHQESVESKCSIIDSIQAGPALVPEFKLYDEVFVVKKGDKIIKESAGALGKYARSALGIKGDHILLVAVSNEAPMTLSELADYMKSLNVDQAIAFDGGSSTSLYVNIPDKPKFVLTSAKNNSARRIKSILLVKED
jgi:exopolysaccharide biosynthesis protein